MSDRSVYERNALAISALRGCPSLRTRFIEDNPGFRVIASRSGLPVPALERGGKSFPLHSTFDPEKEAQRLLDGSRRGGFFACYGMGGGYHVRKLLASPLTTGILVIDFSLELFSSLVSNIDLSDILCDRRVSVIIDPEGAEIEDCLMERYLPFLSGAFSGLPLRSRVDLDRPAFEAAAAKVSSFISRASDDYTVQSKFGKTWFRNAIGNLERAQETPPPLAPVKKALICAAGPSLEEQEREIARLAAQGAFLVSTDTALPFFLKKGIRPGAVVTLDCQHISYYHFMDGYPEGTPLVMDLASPPVLARLASPVYFFSSGHPFCRYASARWRPFPVLDTSGGNVTHAALSLAASLGASEIRLYGADFSYPRGKCYARGTYIYRYFESRATRARPVESLFAEFLFRNPSIERLASVDPFRYATGQLDLYRKRLESFAAGLDADFLPAKGGGAPMMESRNAFRAAPGAPRALFCMGKMKGDFRDFLERYRSALAALAAPEDPALERIRALPEDERDLWTTILPQAAAFSRTSAGRAMAASALLEETRSWTLSIIDEALGRGDVRGRPSSRRP